MDVLSLGQLDGRLGRARRRLELRSVSRFGGTGPPDRPSTAGSRDVLCLELPLLGFGV